MSIQIENLLIGYRHKRPYKPITPPLDAKATNGQLTLLVGANGTGKSTLLRTIAGLQPPLGGEIRINGNDIASLSRQQLAQTVAIVLTQKVSDQQITVEQVVAAGRAPYTNYFGQLTSNDHQLVNNAMEMVGIQHLRLKPFVQLSDGEQQKTLIAKAIAQDTPVILLDEPTAFLDYPTKQQCFQIMRRLAHQQQKTILLSTHDLDLALPQADLVWFMQEGKNISRQSPEKIEQLPDFQQFLKKND